MDIEREAREVAQQIQVALSSRRMRGGHDERDAIEPVIAAALRRVEMETIKRCAQAVADLPTTPQGSGDEH